MEIRTHHINLLHKVGLRAGGFEAYYHGRSCQYKVGTSEERERFYNAIVTLGTAVISGKFVDIGEKPDEMCCACLRLDCRDSYAHELKLAPDEIYHRERIAIVVDASSMLEPHGQRRHEFICRKIDELLENI